MIQIRPDLQIPLRELRFTTSRSSGPGGQNVNKVESRVTLHFDIAASDSLSESQRQKVRSQLGTRINSEGILQISSQEHRTQAANKEAVLKRFEELLRGALKPVRRRIPTKKSKATQARRLDAKRRQSQQKSLRRKPIIDRE